MAKCSIPKSLISGWPWINNSCGLTDKTLLIRAVGMPRMLGNGDIALPKGNVHIPLSSPRKRCPVYQAPGRAAKGGSDKGGIANSPIDQPIAEQRGDRLGPFHG